MDAQSWRAGGGSPPWGRQYYKTQYEQAARTEGEG